VAMFTFTGSTSFAGLGKGKRLASWHVGETSAATIVRFRDGTVTGPILISVNFSAAAQSGSQTYSFPNLPLAPNGWHVEVSAGTVAGSVDLV